MLPIIYKTFNLLLCLIELRLSVTLSAYLFSITLYLSFFLFVCPCISLYLNISSNLPSVPLFLSFCSFLFSVYLILPPPPPPVKKTLHVFHSCSNTLILTLFRASSTTRVSSHFPALHAQFGKKTYITNYTLAKILKIIRLVYIDTFSCNGSFHNPKKPHIITQN